MDSVNYPFSTTQKCPPKSSKMWVSANINMTCTSDMKPVSSQLHVELPLGTPHESHMTILTAPETACRGVPPLWHTLISNGQRSIGESSKRSASESDRNILTALALHKLHVCAQLPGCFLPRPFRRSFLRGHNNVGHMLDVTQTWAD